MTHFPFVQIALAGAFGIDDGRYPVRGARANQDAAPDGVLVVRTFGAPVAARRRSRRRKAVVADPDAQPTVPVTELTVIDAAAIDGDPEKWHAALAKDAHRRDALTEWGLAIVARTLAARRIAAVDAGVPDPSLALTISLRLGYGDGDSLVEGRWGNAIEIPREQSRLGRTSILRPQERVAAIMSGREHSLLCEELILRAAADLTGERVREATLQARVGLEALLAERHVLESPGQAQDLDLLDSRRRMTGDAANAALKGELGEALEAEIRETVAVCQRVLRRRAAHG
ncbi:MAG: hypothetical protein M3383_04720 [Actinomycetota bacterium]|nr:hypothetical protein [Actinomycetota bacterium]